MSPPATTLIPTLVPKFRNESVVFIIPNAARRCHYLACESFWNRVYYCLKVNYYLSYIDADHFTGVDMRLQFQPQSRASLS